MPAANTSSSPPAEERLLRLPLERLHAHPANANLMGEERLASLARNIAREGRYPPLIVRPHPDDPGDYQLLDGHQRIEALRVLGHAQATCYVWPCDDETALLLLATLNRLEGDDLPGRRADLIAELSALLPVEELALLLPEDASAIEQALALIDVDGETLLAELASAAEPAAEVGPRLSSFALLPEDESAVEAAVARAMASLTGRNRRGRALALICRRYLEPTGA